MTYVPSETTSLPASPAITLQNIALNNIPAGGQGSLQLALSTNQSGSSVSAIYYIHFSSDTAPSAPHAELNMFAFATVLPAGDFNNDKSVDPRDYLVWRKTQNTPVTPWTLGDSNGDGSVNDADYFNFRKNFGVALPASAPSFDEAGLSASADVPEPASGLFALVALCAGSLLVRTRPRRAR